MSNPTSAPSALSRDIHLLGNLLGELIVEQHGEEALRLVEDFRKLAIQRRAEGDPALLEELWRRVLALNAGEREILIQGLQQLLPADQHRRGHSAGTGAAAARAWRHRARVGGRPPCAACSRRGGGR